MHSDGNLLAQIVWEGHQQAIAGKGVADRGRSIAEFGHGPPMIGWHFRCDSGANNRGGEQGG